MAEGSGYIVPIQYVVSGQQQAMAGLDRMEQAADKVPQAMQRVAASSEAAMKEIGKAGGATAEQIKQATDALTNYQSKIKEIRNDSKLNAAERNAQLAGLTPVASPTAMGDSAQDKSFNNWKNQFDDLQNYAKELRGVTSVMRDLLRVTEQMRAMSQQPVLSAQAADAKAWLETSRALERAAAQRKNYHAEATQAIATEKELLAVQTQADKLRGKQKARTMPGYKEEEEALRNLTRAEMEKVAVDRLLDKMYKDRAGILAFSSDAYQKEVATLTPLTQQQRIAAETAKLMETAQLRLARAMALTNPEVQKLIKEYKALEAETRRATGVTKEFSLNALGLNNLTASLRAGLAGVGMGFGIYTSATIVAASATYAFVSAIRGVVAAGSEFTGELARINAVMGTSETELAAIEERTRELGGTTRYTATQVSQAFREMGMSGMSFKESMQGVSAVLSLASIGNMDFFQATDIATNVLFGFGMAAEDLTHVVDVMAKTVTSSNQDIQQLGNAMSYAAPVASSFGISLETAAAMTEVLANAGIKASRAGTTLRRTFMALFSDSENVNKQLAELGVSVNFLARDMDQELLRVFKALNVATNGATTNVGNLSKAVGIYATPGFLKLVASAHGAADSLQEVVEASKNVEGAAAEMQKRIEDFIGVDWEVFKAAIEAVQVAFFKLYEESLRAGVQGLAAWVQGLAESDSAVSKLATTLERTVAIVGFAALAFVGLGISKAVVTGWLALEAAIKKVDLATQKATFAAAGFGKWAKIAFNFVSFASGISILVAAIWGLYEAWTAVSEVQSKALKGDLPLAQSNQMLRQDLGTETQISAYSENEAKKAADMRRALKDLQRQYSELEKQKEIQELLIKRNQAQAESVEPIIAKQKELNEVIEKGERDFRAYLNDVLRRDLTKLQEQLPRLEVTLEIEQGALKRAQDAVKDIESRIRAANERYLQANPWTSVSVAANLGESRRGMATGVPEEWWEEYDAAKKAVDTLNGAVAGITTQIRDVQAGLRVAAAKIPDIEVAVTVTANIDATSQQHLMTEIGKLDEIAKSAAAAYEGAIKISLTDEKQTAKDLAAIDAYEKQLDQLRHQAKAVARLSTERARLNAALAKDPTGENAAETADRISLLTRIIEEHDQAMKALADGSPAYEAAWKRRGEQITKDSETITKLNADIKKGLEESEAAMKKMAERTKSPAQQMLAVLAGLSDFESKWRSMATQQSQGIAGRTVVEVQAIAAAVNEYKENIGEFKRLMNEFTSEHDRIVKAMDKAEGAYADMVKKVDNHGEAMDIDRAAIRRNFVEYDRLSAVVRNGGKAYADAVTELAALQAAGQTGGAEWDRLTDIVIAHQFALERADAATADYADGVKLLGDELIAVAKAQRQATLEISKAEAEYKKIQEDQRLEALSPEARLNAVRAMAREVSAEIDKAKAELDQLATKEKALREQGAVPGKSEDLDSVLASQADVSTRLAESLNRRNDLARDEIQINKDLTGSTKDLANAYEEAQQALEDFLRTPLEFNFPDTLKGQTDLMLEQARKVREELIDIRRDLSKATERRITGPSMGAGSGSSVGIGSYSALTSSQEQYVASVKEALKLGNSQTEMLRQSIGLIEERSKALGLNRDMVVALITQESAWNKEAVSRAGARGLMQIMPDTFKQYREVAGVAKSVTAESASWAENIEVGTTILKDLQSRQYGESLRAVMAGYNAGPGKGHMEKAFKGTLSYPETKKHYEGVLSNLNKIEAALKGVAAAGTESDVAVAESFSSVADGVRESYERMFGPLEAVETRTDAAIVSNEKLGLSYASLAQKVDPLEAAFGSFGVGLSTLGRNAEVATAPLMGAADAVTEINKAADAGGLVDVAEAAEAAAKANEGLGHSLRAARTAYASLGVGVDDYVALIEEEARLLAAVKVEMDAIEEYRKNAEQSGMVSEEEKEVIDRWTAAVQKAGEAAKVTSDQAAKLWEALVMEGLEDKIPEGLAYEYTNDQLQSLSEGYNTVKNRTRAYRLEMMQIKQLEDKGYLTHTEAALERINAELEKMDPLTREFSANIVDALWNVATGAEDSKDAIDGLKKSLLDMVKQKYVVQISTKLLGSFMDPVVKALDPLIAGISQSMMGAVQGLGAMLVNSIGGMFGAGTGAAGSGMGGMGGMSNLFGAGGFSNLFGGSSIGESIAKAFGGGNYNPYTGSGSTAAWSNNLMKTPNWAMVGGSIAGGIAGSAVWGKKGYGSIGANLGSSVGAALGSIILPGVGTILGGLLGGQAGGFLGSLFGDNEPKYGNYAMASGGSYWKGLEDAKDGPENYSEGAFGLKFGIANKGSKNFDASELKEIFDGFAKMSNVLADFFGRDVARKIEQSFEAAGGLTMLSKDVDEAMRTMVNIIAKAGAQTGDEIAVIFQSVLGTLSGNAEKVAEQVDAAMQATQAMLDMTQRLEFTDIGAAFDLTGTTAENAVKLVSFAQTMKDAGETTAEAAVRVTAELAQLEFAMRYTATSIEGLSQEMVGLAASNLADSMGGVDKLMAAQEFYYEQFTTMTEKATDAVKLAIAEINREFPKIKDKLLALNIPDNFKIEIPALLDRGGAGGGGPDSEALEEITSSLEDLQRSYAEGQITLARYSVDFKKITEPPASGGLPDTSAEEQALRQALAAGEITFLEFSTQLRALTEGALVQGAEEIAAAQEDLAKAYKEGSLSLGQFALGLKQIFEEPMPGSDLQNLGKAPEAAPPDLAAIQANAEAALRAAEMYAFGLEQGTLTKNTETETKIQEALNYYAAELTAMGYDVTQGVLAVADQIENWAKTTFMSDIDRKSLTKDPNAEIYAKLVNDMPTSREEFNALIAQIDATTDAGALLYAELMKLAPAFDAMYDSIEGFEKWLGVTDDKALAKTRLDKVFADLGLVLPSTKEALKELYMAGKLTAEQLAVLGANIEDFDAYYGEADTWDPFEDLTNATIAKLEEALAKFTDELEKSKAIVQAANSALEGLKKATQGIEEYQQDVRQRARAALSEQRLPDDINEIIQGLGTVDEQAYGTYDDYMAAVLENENLLRQIKLRAEAQVSWDQMQVDLLKEQIALAKEALLREKTELQEFIKDLQQELTEAYAKLQKMWDEGLGYTNSWLEAIANDRIPVLQAEMIGQGESIYWMLEKGFDSLLVPLQSIDIRMAEAAKAAVSTAPAAPVAPPAPAVSHLQYEAPTQTAATNGQDTDDLIAELVKEVHTLRMDSRETQMALVTYARRTTDTFTRWEGDGLPPDREDYLRQIAYNTRRSYETPCA